MRVRVEYREHHPVWPDAGVQLDRVQEFRFGFAGQPHHIIGKRGDADIVTPLVCPDYLFVALLPVERFLTYFAVPALQAEVDEVAAGLLQLDQIIILDQVVAVATDVRQFNLVLVQLDKLVEPVAV